MGISKEQAKKAEALPYGENETTRSLQLEVRRLTEKLSKFGRQRQAEEGKKCNKVSSCQV